MIRFKFQDKSGDDEKIWLLLWSVKQRCFHIETLKEFKERTWQMVSDDGEVTDFLPLASGPNHQAMSNAISDDLRACLNTAATAKILRKGGKAEDQ